MSRRSGHTAPEQAQQAQQAQQAYQSPPSQPSQPRPAQPGAWTKEQRLEWRQWLANVLFRADYGFFEMNADGTKEPKFRVSALSNATGVSRQTIYSWVTNGSQPSFSHASALARALGMHPLAVAFRAGLVTMREMADAIGSGRYVSPDEIREGIEGLLDLPPSPWRDKMLAREQQQLQDALRLHDQLGLSPEEYGTLSAEIVRREVHLDQTPVAGFDAAQLPAEWGTAMPQPPAVTRQPGPRRRSRLTQYDGEPETPALDAPRS